MDLLGLKTIDRKTFFSWGVKDQMAYINFLATVGIEKPNVLVLFNKNKKKEAKDLLAKKDESKLSFQELLSALNKNLVPFEPIPSKTLFEDPFIKKLFEKDPQMLEKLKRISKSGNFFKKTREQQIRILEAAEVEMKKEKTKLNFQVKVDLKDFESFSLRDKIDYVQIGRAHV